MKPSVSDDVNFVHKIDSLTSVWLHYFHKMISQISNCIITLAVCGFLNLSQIFAKIGNSHSENDDGTLIMAVGKDHSRI